ncbi:MAG: serine O-acetyltransferase [Planctomycetota bacterium]
MTPRDRHNPPVDAELVDRVVLSIYEEPLLCYLGSARLPSRESIDELVELLREIVFPGFYGRRGLTHISLPLHVQELLSGVAIRAEEQIRACLRYRNDVDTKDADCPESAECDRMAREATHAFLRFVPELRDMIASDVRAAYDGDPAAHHHDETIFCYPGVEAVFCHRIAHFLSSQGVPLLPRLIQESAHSRTGIDIHPGATIGRSFFIDHGGGVVIGETARIGEGCRIYQGVTLGAKSFAKDEKGVLLRTGEKRHPTLGDRVTVYAGAVVLGGDTVIGDDCVIAGSVFITESVPDGHVVRQKSPELVLRSNSEIMGVVSDDEVPAGG